MDSKIEFNELCRLCLARKNVNIHIFEGEGCKEGIFLKISTCLPVNISLEDKLPKRICSNCFGKLNILYQFYNKSVNSEKQLLEWYNECATENDNETFTDNIDIEMTQDDSEVEVKEEELPFLPEENVNYNIKLEEVNVQDISHQVNEMSHEECSDTIGSNAVTNGEVDTLKSEDDEDGSSVTSNPLRTEINSRYTKEENMSEREECNDVLMEDDERIELDLLPDRSRGRYLYTYQKFIQWCEERALRTYTETVLLVYFSKLGEKMKSSTLWSHYSMLRATLKLKNGVEIGDYSKLLTLLKRKSEGYEPKRAKVLTKEDINKFVDNAPDAKYLMIKVALILGVGGACRCHELVNMNIGSIQDVGTTLLVKLKKSKSKKTRNFSIVGEKYLNLYRKYIALRPKDFENTRLFIRYENGKCHRMVVGIHKLSAIAQEVARYLNLEDATSYTYNGLRSTTLLANSDNNLVCPTRHKGEKSSSVAKGS